MELVLDNKVVLYIAVGALVLSLVFLGWVLTLPNSPLAPVNNQPPATGIVAAQVIVPSPSPSPTVEATTEAAPSPSAEASAAPSASPSPSQ